MSESDRRLATDIVITGDHNAGIVARMILARCLPGEMR